MQQEFKWFRFAIAAVQLFVIYQDWKAKVLQLH